MLSNYLNNNTKAALSALAAGNRFYKNGDYQRAIESYDKAISLKLGDTKFCAKNYFNKGLAQKKLYRYIDSIESYNKAIMLDDKHILAYLAKAEVLQNMQEEHNEASEIEILDCLNTAYEISRDKSLLDSMKLSKVNLDYIQRMFGEREKLLEKFKVASEESNIPAEALAKAQDENSLANDASKDGASMQNPQELLDIGDELFLYLDKIEEAIELYDQAILLDNNLARAYSKKANLLRFQGMITEAIEVINKAINLDPNDPAGYYVKVRILAAQGNTEEATSIYNKALSLDHNDDAYTYFSKGVALTVLSIHEESIEAYDEVIRLKSGNNIFCAAAWNNKGYALNELSRHEEAIVSCNESIRIKPDFTIAYNNKGAALNYLGRYTETIEVLDESIKLKPDDAFAYFHKGTALKNLFRYDDAINSFGKAIRLSPGLSEAYNNKGNLLQSLSRYDEAIECYDAAIKLRPNYALAYNNKGEALQSLSRYEEALSAFNEAIKLNDKLILAYLNKAQTLQNMLIESGGEIQDIEANIDKASREVKEDKEAIQTKRQEILECLNKAYEISQDKSLLSSNKLFSEDIIFINKMLDKRTELLGQFRDIYDEVSNLKNAGVDTSEIDQKLGNTQKQLTDLISFSDDPAELNKAILSGKIPLSRSSSTSSLTQEEYDKSTSNLQQEIRDLRMMVVLQQQELAHEKEKREHLEQALALQKKMTEEQQGEIIKLKTNQVKLQTDQEDHEQRLEKLNTTQVKLQTDQEDQEQRLEKVESNQEQLQINQEDQGHRLLAVEDKTEDHDRKIKVTEDNIEALEEGQQNIKNKLGEDQARIDEHDVMLEEFDLAMALLEETQLETRKIVDQTHERIDGIEQDLEMLDQTLNLRFASLQEEINQKQNNPKSILLSHIEHLNEEDRKKITDYFDSFVFGLSQDFLLSELISTDTFTINTNKISVDIISSLASIIPGTLIVDKVLTRVNDFVKTKELKTSARKITHLAATDIEIYNFAGKLVNRIVSNSDYQQKILSLTETSFEEEDRRFIDKIRKLFETIGQTFDEVLYGAKYKSLHEKLGAIDAGKLIETYLADENIVIHTEEDKEKLANRFYEEIISHTHNSSYITQQTLHSRSIFILQGIIYDNPLLNFLSKKENREMLKELTKYPLTSRGVSKLTDIFDHKEAGALGSSGELLDVSLETTRTFEVSSSLLGSESFHESPQDF